MPLLEYVIKLLAGNSNTLFVGIIVLIFGYYGWLLWNINERLKNYFMNWDDHEQDLIELKSKLNELDESVYKNLINKLNQTVKDFESIKEFIRDNSSDLDRYRKDIIDEIKESTNELKDIIMILMNNKSRSLKFESKKEIEAQINKVRKAIKSKKSDDN
ncbi:MAG: hypothetical protein ACOCRZ_06430 [Halothermotrichaceae bacterium]